MNNKIVLCMLMLSTPVSYAAEVFRCGEPGQYKFSSLPCGDKSETVTLEVTPPSGDPNPYTNAIKAYKEGRAEKAQAKKERLAQEASQPNPIAPQTRGLSLRDFAKVDVGMSEAEVRLLFGAPDNETIDSVNTQIGVTHKSYYYIKTGFNANVSRIIFANGTVFNKTRDLVKNRRR